MLKNQARLFVPLQAKGVESINATSPQQSAMPATSVSSESGSKELGALALSEEEEKERTRLERLVEKGFYQAARALRELRDQKLWRGSHRSFEQYCQDRFGFGRSRSSRLIESANVIENLLPIGQLEAVNKDESSMLPNGQQGESVQTKTHLSEEMILPTSERQVRPLFGLESKKQRAIWNEALKQTGGKVPSGGIIKKVKQQMYPEESIASTLPSVALHLKFKPRGLVEINAPSLINLHQRSGRIYLVHQKTVEVWVRNLDSMTMHKHTLKHNQVEPVEFEREPQLVQVRARLLKLRKKDLEPLDRDLLMLLERPVAFTPREMELLAQIEARYQS